MRVVVAGATGAIGRPLVKRLRERGHDVVGTTRTAAGAEVLAELGARPVVADVLDRERLLDAMRGVTADAVICQLTDLKRPPATHRAMARTNLLRTTGTGNLLAAARRAGATRFLTQSMMFGYGFGAVGRPHPETDPFAPPGTGPWEQHLAAMRANETQVLDAEGIDGIALRYALFYGVGAGDDLLVDGVRKRRLPVIRGGRPLSWVYIDDAAAATVAALEHGEPGNAYNIADDEPVSWERIVSALASAVGAPPPRALPARLLRLAVPYAAMMMAGGVTAANEKAKEQLGWTPQVPSHRAGVALIAAAHGALLTGPAS